MSFFTDFEERLQSTRLTLDQNVQINDPLNYQKDVGTLDFLLNTTLNPRTIDVVQNNNSNAGKYRTVEITYVPHWGDEDLQTDAALLDCNRNNQRRELIDTYDVTCFAGYKFTLDDEYLRTSNETQQKKLDDGFMSSMRVARESMSNQLLAKMAAVMGTNPAQGAGAGAYTDVQVINSDGGVDVNNFDFLANDMDDNYMNGPFAMIGPGANARRYFNRLAVGNLNTNAGVNIADVANQFGSLYFQDQAGKSALGGVNRVLAVAPGLSQFYGYNLFNANYAQNSPDNRIKGTMPDPIYPFEWDFILEYVQPCDDFQGHWVIRVFKYFDLFTVEPAAFGGVYSDLAGFNGIVGYNLTSA